MLAEILTGAHKFICTHTRRHRSETEARMISFSAFQTRAAVSDSPRSALKDSLVSEMGISVKLGFDSFKKESFSGITRASSLLSDQVAKWVIIVDKFRVRFSRIPSLQAICQDKPIQALWEPPRTNPLLFLKLPANQAHKD